MLRTALAVTPQHHALTSKNLKPAARMIQLLLYDVMVCFRSCDRSIKAIEYDSHRCTESVTRQAMQLVSKEVHKMLDASKENIIQIKYWWNCK